MDVTDYIPFFGAILNAGLAIFLLAQNWRSQLNRVACLIGLIVAIWNWGSFQMFIARTPADALVWARFLHFGVIFIPVTFFHLSLLIANLPIRRMIWLFYALSLALALTNFTDLFIAGVHWLGRAKWYSIAGPAYHFFLFPYSLTVFSVVILIKRQRTLPPLYRSRLTPLIIAQSCLLVLGTNDLLPILGIVNYPFTNVPVYPWGSFAAVLYGVVISYSVLQHELLDVRVALGRIAAQFVRLSFLFCIGLCLMFAATLIFPKDFTPFAFAASLVVLTLSGAVTSLLFPKLFGQGAEAVEQRILGDRFEYHDKIKAFTATLRHYDEKDLLLHDLENLLLKTLGAKGYKLFLQQGHRRGMALARAYPAPPDPDQSGVVSPVREIQEFFESPRNKFFLTMRTASGGSVGQLATIRKFLGAMNADICLPLLAEGRPFGLLALGAKSSGEPYTPTDLGLLRLLTENLALILNQMQLTEEVLRNQEMELLGRMSRGMAHDLNNLLTPASTVMQLLGEGQSADEIGDLVQTARRNIETARQYIRDSLFFSGTRTPKFKEAGVPDLVDHAIKILAHELDRAGVRVESNIPSGLSACFDEAMLTRVLTNLISNAADASPPGGVIELTASLTRTPSHDHGADWLRIVVADHGHGISKHDLERIGQAYFTTKDMGDGRRGFGLGLAICRKIVHLHGGQLNITSKQGLGTQVTFEIPATPAPQPAVENPAPS